MEGVEHDLGMRDAFFGSDRFLVAGGHVDRDRPDRRLLLVGERVEERLQALGVAALGGPHDPAAVVVGDAGQELAIGAVADLVHADQLEAIQAAGGQLLGDDPPPRLLAMLLDRKATRAAARADRLLGAQHDRHDHRLRPERHIPDPSTRKPEHPIGCRRDSHVAILRRPLNFEHPAACRRRAAAGRHVRAQPARRTYTATNPPLSSRFRRPATAVSPPNGGESHRFSRGDPPLNAEASARYGPPRPFPELCAQHVWCSR